MGNWGENALANFWRRKTVLLEVAVFPMKGAPVDRLLQFQMYPEWNDTEMPHIEILGTADESRIMLEFRAMKAAEDPMMRNGYLKELVRSRTKIGTRHQEHVN